MTAAVPAPVARTAYAHFHRITTRWADNDAYGHVNNVVYYSWFDTVVNQFLIASGALDIEKSPVIGLVVETHCNYFKSLTFPDPVDAAMRVLRLGTTSVTYGIGLFRDADSEPAAQGHFVHVYVDRQTRRPVPLPEPLRALLLPLTRDP